MFLFVFVFCFPLCPVCHFFFSSRFHFAFFFPSRISFALVRVPLLLALGTDVYFASIAGLVADQQMSVVMAMVLLIVM